MYALNVFEVKMLKATSFSEGRYSRDISIVRDNFEFVREFVRVHMKIERGTARHVGAPEIIGTLRSTTRQGRRRGLQNVKKQCKLKLLKEVTVN